MMDQFSNVIYKIVIEKRPTYKQIYLFWNNVLWPKKGYGIFARQRNIAIEKRS